MHAPLRIEPDCPCLADEIAEPRPDMNIKVAAFTVSEKSSDIRVYSVILNIYSSKKVICSCVLIHI